ncbi:MAG TPA: hypothetical protein VLD86_01910 [Ilumatobacteraceae bacterium]|nr:hypothetical protein [Ilumatobacteraceae bacterium]
MAAPKFAPVPPVDEPRAYSSPDVVPGPWKPNRPADLTGFQPEGHRLGYQGPDQGFAFRIANGFRDRLRLQPGERVADVIQGCLGIALRRASMFGRAPVVHDLTIAFTIWGFLDANPPAEVRTLRAQLFEGLANTLHHYDEARELVDMVPEATLRMTPAQVEAAYPGRWQELIGA